MFPVKSQAYWEPSGAQRTQERGGVGEWESGGAGEGGGGGGGGGRGRGGRVGEWQGGWWGSQASTLRCFAFWMVCLLIRIIHESFIPNPKGVQGIAGCNARVFCARRRRSASIQ